MKIEYFEIKNFKGIKEARIDLTTGAPGNIITLVGLNESGKTTILEALSLFGTEDEEAANLVGTVRQRSAYGDLIPKQKKAAFTGAIAISAKVVLDDMDIKAVENAYRERNFKLDIDHMQKSILIERSYNFKDSTFDQTITRWGITFKIRSDKTGKTKEYRGSPNSPVRDKANWLIGVDVLRARLPKTVYFPTFLFDFPNRIYLEDNGDEINNYYRKILQDVLDAQGEGISIETHVVDRIKRRQGRHGPDVNFLSHLWGSDEKKQIDAVLQKASSEMSKVIFGSWNEIFGRQVTGKRVHIDWLLDPDNNNIPYVEVSIVDGQSTYSLSERSLGFRWFFSFLLFTQFRVNRKSEAGTIFLLDEPASNLHSRAQIKLLDSFSKIANRFAYIVYSTHSHYMINPTWLEKAYIVKNAAADYDAEEALDFYTVRETDIKAVKYKTFVGSYPHLVTYFQPVLDALDVSFSPLVQTKNALVVEGKFDYHPLTYFLKKLCKSWGGFSVFPATGSGAITPLISLFRGWGIDFRIILDGDDAGKKEKTRYLEQGLISADHVKTLDEFGENFKGKALEAAYKDDVCNTVMSKFNTKKPKKDHFSLFFQELIASGQSVDFKETEEILNPLVAWLESQFKKEGSQNT
ncbi:ATP-dependent nuclease [Trinickia terrae]|uniref:ATP-dependent nuclease n=1 Tax=Trinickia terrae TaxID=2571161 RepID=UPI00146DFD50|nr:AAA family ATPase [Trinickia terrae]